MDTATRQSDEQLGLAMLRDAKRLGRYLIGGAILGASLGYLGRHELDPGFLLLICFGLLYLSPIILLVCFRQSFALTVLCLGAALIVGLICATSIVAPADAADKKDTMAYVDSIKPRLEDFRQKHGGYPDRLEELGVPSPPHWGLDYKRERHHPPNPETYRIDFGSLEYMSDGAWFDDD